VARKKTALELSQQRGKQGFDPRQLGISAGVGLLLALALACVAQGVQVLREQAIDADIEALRERTLAAVGAYVAERQKALGAALADAELGRTLTIVDETGRLRAGVLLRQRLPDLVSAEFFAAELPELLSEDLSRFGYARANILAEARSAGGVARAQAHRDHDGPWQLALAQAVRGADDRILAYAYVRLPGGPLQQTLAGADFSSGRIELRQGMFGSAVLAAAGSSGSGSSDERQAEIPQSIFSVATSSANLFKLGDHLGLLNVNSGWGMVLFGLLLLGNALALVLLRGRLGFGPEPVAEVESLPVENIKEKLARIAANGEATGAATASAHESRASAAAKPAPTATNAGAAPAAALDRSIFRAYDIRGVVGKTLTSDVARLIGQSIGTALRERALREIAVGRDGRSHGPDLTAALIAGLRSAGCDVIDIGQVPTPVLYFATYHLNVGSGVMVTGSHNPPQYNGFKIMIGGETLAEQAIQELYARIAENRLATGHGGLQVMDVIGDYVERITGDVQVERKLKLVVDAGNGVAGAVAPQVLEGIGCEVVPLHCEVDGSFPNHHPDPSDPENLRDLIMTVKQLKADVGIAFDGDGDRLGVVTGTGEIIWPDRLLMLFAIDVLNRNPGAAVIYDVKCTGQLQDLILRHGGSPMMWKTGHSLIKAKMREEDAELAGEMSGHFFFRERWFGFDDAIYAAARLAEIVGASARSPQELFDELPKGVSTPELKIATEEGAHYAFIAKFREKASFPGARVSTIDGVRADYPDGWGLVRCSNTTPNLVLRFDAENAAVLKRIQETFREQLLALDPKLELPF
jgi:phosphomannomutase/phosphoglucomutase